ncbi:MAG: hypothetical protein ACRERR_02220 [Moraxellaceae bacterium]
MLYRTLCCLIVTCLFVTPASAGETQQTSTLTKVGSGTPKLTEEWWQWAMSASRSDSPVADLTGASCHVGQRGETWFLAGGFGSSKIRRTCVVPKGKSLFFPIINMVYWPTRYATTFTCEQAKTLAALNNDTAIDLFAEINGEAIGSLKQYRLASTKCFDVFARVPASLGPYKAFPSATDGYWLYIKPLPQGRHVLKFGGKYNRNSGDYGRMLQDIEYVLQVK